MKFVSKITCALVLLLSFGFAQAIEPIKSGDVLKLKIIPLVSTGQTFSDGAESFDSATMQIDSATGERTYTRAKEDVVWRKNKFFGVLQWNKYVYAADEIGNVLPADLSFGQKGKETVWFNSETVWFNSKPCGRVKNDFEVTVGQGPDVVVNIKGVPITLKTLQIIREGTWYTSKCGGSGKNHLKALFSPELNEIVYDEFRIYDRGTAYEGEKMILESIN